MVDFHTHSTASDGELSAEQIAALVAQKKIKAWALTDHDSVAALKQASAASKKYGIEFIPGVEVNVKWPTGEFHLLGLGLTHCSLELEKTLFDLEQGRFLRNQAILKKISDDGIKISMEDLFDRFNTKSIGRPHIAKFLCEKKIVKNFDIAFKNFLGRGKKWFVERSVVDLDQAVSAILTSGGIPVLAHPLSLYVTITKLSEIFKTIFDHKVLGIEAWHPSVKSSVALKIERIAKAAGFFVTGGSDFHGPKVRPERMLGHASSGIEIADKFWTCELKPNLLKLRGEKIYEW